jgi:hypothetical protein
LALTALILAIPSIGTANTVYIGDPTDGGVRYHLTYAFDNTGALSAATGQSLAIQGTGTRIDSNSDGIVDTIASKSYHDLGTLGSGIVPGTYGWTHTSRWSLIDLNGLYDAGHTNVQLSVTLEAFNNSGLIPGFALWQGKEDAGNWSSRYVNGIDSTNWSDWNGGGACAPAGTCSYFPTLAQAGLAGNVWAVADDRTNPTGLATVVLNALLAEGGNNYFTLVMGGNADLASTGVAQAFQATVSVAPVPVPAAVYLFGSGLIGLAGLARRRMKA